MLGTLAYMAALGAPEIAEAAAQAGVRTTEAVGRHLAAGMLDEVANRIKPLGGLLGGSLAQTMLAEKRDLSGSGVLAAVEARLNEALSESGVSMVPREELDLLRKLATRAASGKDVSAEVSALRAFHHRQAGPAA